MNTVMSGAGSPPQMRNVNIRIGGFGGCGGHILDFVAKVMQDVSYPRVDNRFGAFNTDYEDLYALENLRDEDKGALSGDTRRKTPTPMNLQKKVFSGIQAYPMGFKATGGGGAGSDPVVGLAAAEESRQAIIDFFQDADFAILVGGLGGGTGSSSLPYAAELFQKEIMGERKGKNFPELKAGIVFAIQPFTNQGRKVGQIAEQAMEKLQLTGMPIIPIPNDLFASQGKAEGRLLTQMFEAGNKQIAEALCLMSRMLGVRHSIQNIDRNDQIRLLTLDEGDSPLAYFGAGRASGEDRIVKALVQVSKNGYMKTSLAGCRKVLLSIHCPNMSEAEWEQVQDFMGKHQKQDGADWRHGISADFQTLPFEEEGEVSIFVIGSDHKPLTASEGKVGWKPAEKQLASQPAPAPAQMVSSLTPAESPAAEKPTARHITGDAEEMLAEYDDRTLPVKDRASVENSTTGRFKKLLPKGFFPVPKNQRSANA